MNPIISDQVVDQIKAIMAPAMEKIGQGAQYGWEIVVRQQTAEGLVITFALGIFLLVSIVSGYVLYKAEDKGVKELSEGVAFVSLILVVIALLIFLTTGMLHLLNPEFYAIEFFLKLANPTQ